MEFSCACRFDFRGGGRKEKERGKDGGRKKEGGEGERKREIRKEGGREKHSLSFYTLTTHFLQSVIPPLTPQTPLTPDSMGQISPHPGMSAFTYPSAPSNYDAMQQIPTTPTQTAVSPIVTYQQNPVWASPTDTIAHFETSVDYSSPMVGERGGGREGGEREGEEGREGGEREGERWRGGTERERKRREGDLSDDKKERDIHGTEISVGEKIQ